MAKSKPGKIHAILGRSRRTGRWRLGPRTSVVAVLGTCRLDLRQALIDGEISKMSATVFLGGVTIVIPPGVEVRPSGLSLLGGASINVPAFDDVGEAVLIELEWTSIFGRLRVGAEDQDEVGVGAEDQAEVEVGAEDQAEVEMMDEPAETVAETVPSPPASAAPTPAVAVSPPGGAAGSADPEETPIEPEPEPAAVGIEDL